MRTGRARLARQASTTCFYIKVRTKPSDWDWQGGHEAAPVAAKAGKRIGRRKRAA